MVAWATKVRVVGAAIEGSTRHMERGEVDDALAFAMDLRSRVANRVQITTDGHLAA